MSNKIIKSEEVWRKELDPEAFRVLREHGTERAFTSPLNSEKRDGMFLCAGCGKPVFAAAAKFESGTGWPSFYQPAAPDAVGTKEDRSWFMRRTEVHCDDCGGHLGHVFNDGPKPTGLRYCINGCALTFKPDTE
jgi:peptide-methionine (R)-S-oxide reductase